MFHWGEEQGIHRRARLMACAVCYRSGLPQAMGIRKAFPECEFWYIDAQPRTVRYIDFEGGVFGPDGALSGHAQTAIVAPMVGDSIGMARLLDAAARDRSLGQPVVMNIFTGGAALTPPITKLDWFANDSIVETVRLFHREEAADYVIEGHLVPKDFQKLAFGPFGPGYPVNEDRLTLMEVADTGLGQAEAFRGLMMVGIETWRALESRSRVPCTMPWLSSSLSLLYATAHAEIPGRVADSGKGYFWLSPLAGIRDELIAGGLVQQIENNLSLTTAGLDYLGTVVIPALRPSFPRLFEEFPKLIERRRLTQMKPWNISQIIWGMGDSRFPRALA